jgi:drug/metabolite transporter (DMT)-like permease
MTDTPLPLRGRISPSLERVPEEPAPLLRWQRGIQGMEIWISSAIFGSYFNMAEKRKIWHWLVLALLSLIWGTSYILMKKGLESFSSIQIGSLRIFITFLCLLPIAIKNLSKLNRKNILSLLIIGFCGNAIPAYLFPLSETHINSSLAGMLNSLSPVFTLVIGILIYKRKAIRSQVAGVFVGLIGAAGLLYTGSFTFAPYGLFVVLATILYGFTSNEVSKVRGLNGIQITALAFFVVSPPAILHLAFSDHSAALATAHWTRNLCFIAILAIVGSATAQALYYVLIRDTSPVFASIVTYFIPIVATMWGLADNEHLTSSMLVAVIFVFAGVYIINKPDFLKKRRSEN